jgi:hypothetical protein
MQGWRDDLPLWMSWMARTRSMGPACTYAQRRGVSATQFGEEPDSGGV